MRLRFGTADVASRRKPHHDHPQSISSAVPATPNPSAQVMALLGLQHRRSFFRDTAFLCLLALGPMAWLSMMGVFEPHPLPWYSIWSSAFFSVVFWQPLFEELLFRGIIQGHVLHSLASQPSVIGLSIPNLFTSFAFSLAHLAHHSTTWSLLVFVPSLCFGLMRDRVGSVYPSIVLHVFYNAGYFLLTGGATLLNSSTSGSISTF